MSAVPGILWKSRVNESACSSPSRYCRRSRSLKIAAPPQAPSTCSQKPWRARRAMSGSSGS